MIPACERGDDDDRARSSSTPRRRCSRDATVEGRQFVTTPTANTADDHAARRGGRLPTQIPSATRCSTATPTPTVDRRAGQGSPVDAGDRAETREATDRGQSRHGHVLRDGTTTSISDQHEQPTYQVARARQGRPSSASAARCRGTPWHRDRAEAGRNVVRDRYGRYTWRGVSKREELDRVLGFERSVAVAS